MFMPDGAGPVMACPAFRFMAVCGKFLITFKPVWAFPAKFFTEVTIEIAQPIISGGDALTATGHAFLAGKMDIVILSIGFKRARRGVIKAVVVWAKTADVEPPHVPLRAAVHDPLGHDLAD